MSSDPLFTNKLCIISNVVDSSTAGLGEIDDDQLKLYSKVLKGPRFFKCCLFQGPCLSED